MCPSWLQFNSFMFDTFSLSWGTLPALYFYFIIIIIILRSLNSYSLFFILVGNIVLCGISELHLFTSFALDLYNPWIYNLSCSHVLLNTPSITHLPEHRQGSCETPLPLEIRLTHCTIVYLFVSLAFVRIPFHGSPLKFPVHSLAGWLPEFDFNWFITRPLPQNPHTKCAAECAESWIFKNLPTLCRRRTLIRSVQQCAESWIFKNLPTLCHSGCTT